MNNKDMKSKKDKNKNKNIIQNIIIIILLLIIIMLLLSRCGAIDKFHDSPQIKNNTESNVSNNDNDTVNSGYDNSNNDLIPIDKNATEDGNNIASSEADKTGDNYNKFIGYSNVIVNKSYPTLELKNDKFNQSYAKYIIYNNGIKIYETNLIAPGKLVNWNVIDTLKEKGTYKLTQSCSFYDVTFDNNGNVISQTKNGTDINNSSLEITIE